MEDNPTRLEWPENNSNESRTIFCETLNQSIGDAQWLYFVPYPATDNVVEVSLSKQFSTPLSIQGSRYALKAWKVPFTLLSQACDSFFGQRLPELFIVSSIVELSEQYISEALSTDSPSDGVQVFYFDDNRWVP